MASSGGKKRGPFGLVTLVGGVLLTLAGVALLVLPGPGIPLLIAGLVLLSREIPAVAKLADRAKEHVRKRKARRGPTRLPGGTEGASPPGAAPLSRKSDRPVLS
jgi:hypothetical protein